MNSYPNATKALMVNILNTVSMFSTLFSLSTQSQQSNYSFFFPAKTKGNIALIIHISSRIERKWVYVSVIFIYWYFIFENGNGCGQLQQNITNPDKKEKKTFPFSNIP